MVTPTVLLVNKFIHDVGPAGGVGKHFLQLREGLEAAGWRVVPFGTADPHALPSPWSRHYARYRDFSRPRFDRHILSNAFSLIWNREAARKLNGLLREVRPDVAHLHNIYHHLSPSILPVLARHRVPVVMTLHDMRLLCPGINMTVGGDPCRRCLRGHHLEAIRHRCVHGSRPASLLAAMETWHRRFRRLYRRYVQLFICPSHFIANMYSSHGFAAEQIRHLSNFVDLAEWNPAAVGLDLATETDRGPGRDSYVYFGRLSREKGLETLLHALACQQARAAVSGERPLRLVILGDGPVAGKLKAMAADLDLHAEVRVGWHDVAVIQAELARACFTVLPSTTPENGPLSLLESLACGLPVVSTDLGGIPEALQPGKTGLLVQPDDPRALLAGLEQARSFGYAERRLARQWTERHANGDLYLRQLIAIYNSLRPGAQVPAGRYHQASG